MWYMIIYSNLTYYLLQIDLDLDLDVDLNEWMSERKKI